MPRNRNAADNNDLANQISESELIVMQVIWQATEPVSVQYVQDQINETEGWQYNTIATFMVRLADKGFLEICHQDGRGRTRLFVPKISEEDYLKSHLKQTIKRQFRGSAKAFFAAYMSQEKLEKDEIDELREWLDKQ
ncbi:MAG: BlaI/MecI/CopY family transcriptional regulator [Eubacteriales bacterium]|nr:BlaI/MecI/CopY family transcriptional regulator [Eubacteriales bacterium]